MSKVIRKRVSSRITEQKKVKIIREWNAVVVKTLNYSYLPMIKYEECNTTRKRARTTNP